MKFVLIAPPPRLRKQGLALPSLCDAWLQAIDDCFAHSEPPFEVIEGKIQDIEPSRLCCDCIVSPANSYGIMDGGFDLELSKQFKGSSSNLWSLTDYCQDHISKKWHGYAPPGSCTIIPLHPSVACSGNKWNSFAMAILPTMRTPEDVSWHKDLVYNTMWTFLVELDHWNTAHHGDEANTIHTVLMTGLGTGQGGISLKRSAQQMILAVRHFQEGVPAHVRWDDVRKRNEETQQTEDY